MAGGVQKLISVDYEVFGRVQGVFFRKHTSLTARKYGLKGWVRNTDNGTVVGTVQGPDDKVKAMKDWLQCKGSPHSKIEKCVFGIERSISKLEHAHFEVKH